MQPAHLIQRLMQAVASRDAANAAVGDLLDELSDRAASARAPRWPHLWLNVHAAAMVMSFAMASMPRHGRAMEYMFRDAVRSLRRSPGYSLLVISLLAVGIAAGTITYSVVDAVVLNPIDVERSDRIVLVPTRDDQFKPRITIDAVRKLRTDVAGFDSVASVMVFSGSSLSVAGGYERSSVGSTALGDQSVVRASSDLFKVLRFTPAIGRAWTADEEARGETNVAVLGYRFWRNRFGGDANVLGRTIETAGKAYTVIGMLGADSDVADLSYGQAAVWLPTNPASTTFGVLGRMRDDVTPAQLAEQIQRAIATPDWRPDVAPLLEQSIGKVRGWMLMALGAVGLVVLIACVNAANIMLTRSFRRSHELAIRSSLGASRRQIAFSVMAEGLVLSLTASACALIISVWGVRAARSAVTTLLVGVYRASSIALNERVLLAAITAAVITGVFASLVPAWLASRASVNGVLKDAAPTVVGSGRRWRSGLLIAEISCVTVLMVVSWLFVASLIRVAGVDLGIDRSRLLAVSPNGSFAGTVDEVRQRLEAIPGVSDVAVAAGGASLPLVGRAFSGAWITTSIERAQQTGGAGLSKVLLYRVTSNYFDIAGIRFQRGGSWQADGDTGSVVLDERAAANLFGSDDPLGRQIRATEPEGVFTVTGVVQQVHTRGAEEADDPAAYFAIKPSATRKFAGFFLRTSRPPAEMVPVVVSALADVAPASTRPYVFAADEAVQRITATRRFNAWLMLAFGSIAMLIGAFGVYGVIATMVAQETREIGLRVALGATPQLIRRNVLRVTGRYVLAGLAIGLPLAWWLSRGLEAYLFQVTAADASVYVGVSALVLVVGLAASLMPAHRASRTDPMITLRS